MVSTSRTSASSEWAHSTALVDNDYVVKIYRTLQAGISPEIEMGRFLTDVAHFKNAPALLGSVERFFGILVEHYAGNFPLWLAWEQVAVIPVRETTTRRMVSGVLLGMAVLSGLRLARRSSRPCAAG